MSRMLNPNAGPMKQPNMTLDQTKPVICEKCSNDTFSQGMLIRKVSRLLTGEPKDGYTPIPTFVCMKCGSVNDEFLPDEIKEERKQNKLIT